jgi:hypothetical protein
MVFDMIKKICSNPRTTRSLSLKNENKGLGNDIEFEKIVKFLNDQKAVMDYADLN